ncbi:MAG: ABC transporter permease [Chloroflexi bacterium]|nr:MAG: ABC transporter permease [Chloroflexota bacterium]TMG35068.1 MAG: ABC transporter permease [Chloroflexota bacterium]
MAVTDRATTRVAPRSGTIVEPAPVLAVPKPDTWFKRNESKVIGTISVTTFLVLWQSLGFVRAAWPQGIVLGGLKLAVPPTLFLPVPSEVILAFRDLVQGGELAQDVAVSLQEFAIGYVLAVVVGVLLGLGIGWYRRFSYAVDPFITFFYATPRIVLLPLLIIWFGIGIWSKIAVVFLGAFFAIVINTAAGVRNLDANLIKVARSFGATDLQLFRTIALPGSVPFVLTGLRLGIGHALVGVVVGELVAAQHGIGRLMAIAGSTFQSDKVFAGLIIIASAGMLTTLLLQRLERRYEAWRPRAN